TTTTRGMGNDPRDARRFHRPTHLRHRGARAVRAEARWPAADRAGAALPVWTGGALFGIRRKLGHGDPRRGAPGHWCGRHDGPGAGTALAAAQGRAAAVDP